MMLNDYVITIDVDWAPDWAIEEVANVLIANNVKATWFITHDSQEIRNLFIPLFGIGLHPNFEEGSTQGKNHKEVMRHLKRIVPHAKPIRTHGLVQSSRLLQMMREEFDILHDASLFLPEIPNIIPQEIFFRRLKRDRYVSTFLGEDDVEMHRPEPCFSLTCNEYHVRELKIFNFHPVHIVLNSSDMNICYSCKRHIDITKCSHSDLQPYHNTGYGTGTFFKEIVKFILSNSDDGGKTISQLALELMNSKSFDSYEDVKINSNLSKGKIKKEHKSDAHGYKKRC